MFHCIFICDTVALSVLQLKPSTVDSFMLLIYGIKINVIEDIKMQKTLALLICIK